MSRLAIFIHIEDEIHNDLNTDPKKSLHLSQRSYWQAHYSDRIGYDTFNRIYRDWKSKQVVSA